MKKFLSYALVAMMLVSLVALGVSAVDWVAGGGYDVYTGASYGEAESVGKSPVTLTTNDDGSVTVEQGGYYHGYTFDGNWGGAATATQVGLDGLEVTVTFDEAPVPTNDCWFGILLLQKPEVFSTGDMASNTGYVPLIRFNVPNLEYHDKGFGGQGSSEIDGTLFGIQSGDTIKMSVRYELGQYMITYDHNGKVFEVPAEMTASASEVFTELGGKAHVVLTGTLLGDLCDWKYTASVVEGVGLSEEQLANQAFEKSKLAAATEIAGYAASVDATYATAVETAGDSTAEEITAAVAEIEAAVADAAAAQQACIDAADQAGIDAAIQAGKDAKAKADSNLETVTLYVEMMGDVTEEAPVEEAPVEEAPVEETPVEEAPAEEGGNTTLIIIIVVVVVVVIAVLAVVLGKKKKN